MTDLFDGLPDEPEAFEGQIVPSVKELINRPAVDVVRDIAKEIADETVRVNKDILHFADIDPEQTLPPDEWVDELGVDGAMRRLRTAKYALMSAKEAPVALKIASALGGAIMKAKAAERNVTNELHIQKLFLSAPIPEYPELEVENDDG